MIVRTLKRTGQSLADIDGSGNKAMRKYRFTAQFEKSYSKLPDETADLFDKKLPLFLKDIRHPSFRTKKMEGLKSPDIRESSLSMKYRFTFQVEKNGMIVFRNIGEHAILEKRKV